MAQKHFIANQELISAKLVKRMLLGLMIGLVVISFFIFRVPNPKPEWGEMWRIRPLIITPLAGAFCGAAYHIIQSFSSRDGWRRTLGVILGVLVYVIGLWMGIVLGLDGTMWN
jgi:hypothetical protein